MDTPRTPDEPAPDKPPRPDEPAPAVVLVLGEKVADGAEDDLNRVVDNNLDLLGPLREFLLRNKVPRVARVVTAVTRDELLSPDGFLLTFRVDGPNIQVSLNDRVIMSATDSSPDAYHSGRIALFASRIIATFEKLEIVPLDSE